MKYIVWDTKLNTELSRHTSKAKARKVASVGNACGERGRYEVREASARACKRCGEVGNVEHDNAIDMCNVCTDEIQGGADSYRFDQTDRYGAKD